MGLFRIILYMGLGVMIWHIGKRLFRAMTPPEEPPYSLQMRGQMVRCAHCGLHVPKQEALNQDETFFCCEAHRKAFLEHQE